MKKTALSRRTLLRGAGGIAIGLPLLEIMGCSRGDRLSDNAVGKSTQAVDGPPKRLVLFYTQNGSIPENFWPQGGESSFQLSPILTPLAPYRNRLLILKGINNDAAVATGGNEHASAVSCALTGRTGVPFSDVGAGGISIDQHVANAVGTTSRLRSLEFGVYWPYSSISFYGSRQPVPYEDNPANIYDRMFLDYQPPGSDLALAKLRADRRSMLDAVAQNFQILNGKLGRSDRQRLDMHLTMLRDVERRLAAPSGACTQPARPPPDMRDDPAAGQTHMDLLALALACDFTRVGSMVWADAWYDRPPLSISGDYHGDVVHYTGVRPAARDTVTRVKTLYANQFKYLLDRLNSLPEGSGTVLDNTLLVWLDEFMVGADHSHEDLPYVLAGGAPYFRTGRFIEYTDRPANNRLWISVMNAMGIPGNNFGDPAFGSSPLPNLT